MKKITVRLDDKVWEQYKLLLMRDNNKSMNQDLNEYILKRIEGEDEMTKKYELQIELNGEYEELGTFSTKKELMDQYKIYKDEDEVEGHNNNYYCSEKTDEDVVNFYQL